MSADNGIYIGKFYEGYRVIHAQAIENCEGSPDDDVTLAYINTYFGKAKVFRTSDEAWTEARYIYDQMRLDDFFILEYGISEVQFNIPFPEMSEEKCKRLMGALW